MATPNPTRRAARRISRAQSISSDSPSTPAPTPPPTRRGRGVRAASDTSPALDTPSQVAKPGVKAAKKLPGYYFLAPTLPSPFIGTLDASLDAILSFSSLYSGIAGVSGLITALLGEPKSATNWSDLLTHVRARAPDLAKHVTTELLMLATRTLLPEQISENRAALARLYDKKKQLAIRLVLRYDMLREWKMESGSSWRDTPVSVPSLPPTMTGQMATVDRQPEEDVAPKDPDAYSCRRALLPNILPTLIAAPPGGFTTHAVRERMKHHVTDLDDYLVLSDEEVEGWGEWLLGVKTCFVLLHWQWLRRNNEILDEMEVRGWEELEGRADECVWIADEVRRAGVLTGLGMVVGAGG